MLTNDGRYVTKSANITCGQIIGKYHAKLTNNLIAN